MARNMIVKYLSHSTAVATKKEKKIAISFSIEPNFSAHIELKSGSDLVC